MDTLTDEANVASPPNAPKGRADVRASIPSVDGDVQVQWFERMKAAPEPPAPVVDLDVDVSFDDDDDDVPTHVFRRARSIWTSED